MTTRCFTPRMKPLSARKTTILSVLDVGTSKVACLIARLMPAEPSDMLRGRTHRCRILGIGHQRSRGLKGGAVVDMEEAEQAIRLAVDAAERMARVQVESVIVNVTGGRLGSSLFSGGVRLGGKPVSEHDTLRVLEAAAANTAQQGRAVLHSLPNGFAVDSTTGIRDPKGMMGDELRAAIDGAATHFGGLDILFSNAGRIGTMAGVQAFNPEAWDDTQNLLLRSVAAGASYAVPHMVKRGAGAFKLGQQLER